ncbi:hypothetical protein A3C20_02810 [Candidatus Kaiserbacteria bacterium RIFCSPHIGHO2_02_FULL_55_25]|uniref:DOD-type homing endonuclease domain-containing protein n=1 Tax=Candidatus Kaiserbacteria bacterium RIFCSPHIGHO2_02_FULL_55_25 TaxID=1798498 RepID=A0A1F6E6M2_9BACT|nr:MAG: hypothetical protein A2764_01915 [Candidatus Kaiserbacteria bacterium RIFCSPHIGHO2_01_FULL_55_79]OGG69355.1 MAG: hypothetical protein A3C20_02810 [Candidatus Kaiserbacteria bacterium RIFCSPHIGHO2_02_FULL_55_25]OGG77689.1 MAG: hypothetical protein A3F56_00325 [Candidatus Kaiserbacteria bacterium RIFCSPHIGHO2_12_FULL_55_13]OGG83366.1 MAG: hypothetical protein A3A42_04080 [Candidatus Kaiserbacteria bacterium RIFCSPLOWO2_01_FULL_55_25]
MARRWTGVEERMYRRQLRLLYVRENKTIAEVAHVLNLAEASVFGRLKRLEIPTCRPRKKNFNNQRSDVHIPARRSKKLAEIFGILLGDGHISHYQVTVTLGTKELVYAQYVQALLREVFGGVPKISTSGRGHKTVYLGSTAATRWLKSEGLVQNKVIAQVDAPRWVFERRGYMKAFLRGFFDTDGSIYKLRYGMQISLTNKSAPLLLSLQRILRRLGYKASDVSAYRVYVTRVPDVKRFFREVIPANLKHQRRFREIASHASVV